MSRECSIKSAIRESNNSSEESRITVPYPALPSFSTKEASEFSFRPLIFARGPISNLLLLHALDNEPQKQQHGNLPKPDQHYQEYPKERKYVVKHHSISCTLNTPV
ncbi:hypothetical protein TorRG33x02_048020 [Trema orientale]|uniref:Uncharacterized protein n=1 Tax=Trema orientale TaxID=63057 RepID=A0A2P5FN95_TREOI|nr:hypothetical protein TorRG33x02_048020 [Trema orientale]